MRLWHPVIVTIDGPNVTESESTFRNYRFDVTFTKGNKSFKVPGFFAADGNAAETSATSGNKWRAIFTPNEVGDWTYTVSFRKGKDIAIYRLFKHHYQRTGSRWRSKWRYFVCVWCSSFGESNTYKGYKFDGWYADDKLISTNFKDDINIETEYQLKAKFSLIKQ